MRPLIPMGSARLRGWGGVVALSPLLTACELTEVTIAETVETVIVEGLVRVFDEREPPGVMVFLHRSLGEDATSESVPGAVVRVTVPDRPGSSANLVELPIETCLSSIPVGSSGSCYMPSALRLDSGFVGPGDRVELQVVLPDGGTIEGSTRVPGAFDLLNTPAFEDCSIPPDSQFEMVWSVSEGAWAYVSETSIADLRGALAPLGIPVEDDPFHLLGLSISASDTTVVYPGELGVFSRTELDQRLALQLQIGLPLGVIGEVTITAVDRNFVNWARGGSFNPSGPVRLPSVVGDGTGFFGSAVVRPVEISVVTDEEERCG